MRHREGSNGTGIMAGDYEKRLLRVLDYVYANLDGDLSLDRLADEAALSCYYTTEYASKKDALDGEETIANMVAAHTLTLEEREAGRTDPKLTITRCVNAMQRCEYPAPVRIYQVPPGYL